MYYMKIFSKIALYSLLWYIIFMSPIFLKPTMKTLIWGTEQWGISAHPNGDDKIENDLDYPIARALAAEVIATKSFEPISDERIEDAKKRIDTCEMVLCCRKEFGTFESANHDLLEYAKLSGKKIEFR